MKKTTITGLLILALLSINSILPAQSNYFTQEFDFYRINTKSFTLNVGDNNQQKHLWSSVNTCVQLADLAQHGTWNESRLIGSVPNNIKIRATKLSYTPFGVQWGNQQFELRMIFVRPDDNKSRPCILLSPGGGADVNNWYNYLALGVADYVSRGYAVAFYENFNNRYVMEAAAAAPNAATNLPVEANGETAFYALYQFARAAAQYVVGQHEILNVNTEQLFAGGNSAGGFSAYALALADESNFTHPVFETLGEKNDKVYPAFANAPFVIKGIGILGSGLFKPNALMGDLIDADDDLSCAVLWHGGQDVQIRQECCAHTPCNGDNTLEICGASAVGRRLCEAGILNDVRINCPGGHLVVASLLNTGQIKNDPTPAVVLGPLYRELQQMMDVQQVFALRFSQAMQEIPATECSSAGVKPQNYPNPLGNNWHLAGTSMCAQVYNNVVPAQSLSRQNIAQGSAIVWPNPFTNTVRLEWNLPDSESVCVEIYDVFGRQKFLKVLENCTAKACHSVDIAADWPAGMYYWVVKSVQQQLNGTIQKN